MSGQPRRRSPVRGVSVLIVAVILLLAGSVRAPAAGAGVPTAQAVPTLAYYYIWFNASSWNRAKTDYPLAGRYSSDEVGVMRRHVELAKRAGLTGFIVSWKSTPLLDSRLSLLTRVAREEGFKLAIIYQGLNFSRAPLPVAQIERDLDRFADDYAIDPVFRVFDGKPLVIISGTWRFSRAEIERLTATRRDRLLILASEKDVAGYERLDGLVDGDAYYWSSADPERTPGYQAKLDAFSQAVHEGGGLWIAPAAAGFDARLVGGTRIIDRRGGETFRLALDAAIASSPDAIGVISWNEFSENSQIEPSREYGSRSLEVLSGFLGASFAASGDLDSSAPAGRSRQGLYTLIVIGGLLAVAIPMLVSYRRRRGRPVRAPTGPPASSPPRNPRGDPGHPSHTVDPDSAVSKPGRRSRD